MFVELSRFFAAPGTEDRVRRAFIERPCLVEGRDGIVRMEVLQPVREPREFLLLTFWRDAACCRAWRASIDVHGLPATLPGGLMPVSAKTGVEELRVIAEWNLCQTPLNELSAASA